MSSAPGSSFDSPAEPRAKVIPGPDLAHRVVRNTGVLAASQLLVRALGMGLMILLARYLGAEGYGTYQRAEAFVFLFSILANLGLDMILTREVARGTTRTPEYLGGILALKLGLGLLTFAVIQGVAGARGYEGDFLWGIRAFSLVLVLNSLAQAVEATFQGLEVMRYVALANLSTQIVTLVLGVACILSGKDLRWIIGTIAVATAFRVCLSGYLLFRLRMHLSRPHFATLRYLLRESLPLAFAASFVIVYQQVDAVMLGEMKGNAEVGWYKAGAKFLLVFTVLRESFMLAVYPVLASVARHQPERLGGLLTRAARYQIVVALYFILCFVFLSRVAPKLLGADFANSGAVLPVLAWILLPQTLSITAGRALIATGNQGRLLVSTSLSLLTNIALNLVLIPPYGFLGAAAASVVSEMVVASLNLYYVNHLVAKTSILRAVARPAGAALVTGVALYFLRDFRLYAAIPVSIALYAVTLWAFRALSVDEVRQLVKLVRQPVWGGRPRAKRGAVLPPAPLWESRED